MYAATSAPTRALAAATEPPLINGRGLWSLERLGYGAQRLTSADVRPGFGPGIEIAGVELPFRLPAGASQGPRDWYLIKLHYRLELDEKSEPGLVTLYSSSNGRTMAALDFRVLKSGSPPLVRGSAVRLGGRQLHIERKTTWKGVFTNYFQIGGVRPGKSSLTLTVSQEDGAHFKSLDVFADSGILVSPNGPSAVRVIPSLSDRDIRVDERFRVGFTVHSIGEAATANGSKISISAPKLRVVGPRSVNLKAIPVGKRASGSFTLVSPREGTFPVTLRFQSWNGEETVRLAARVTADGPAPNPQPASAPASHGESDSAARGWIGGAVAALVLLAIALVYRRRRSTPPDQM